MADLYKKLDEICETIRDECDFDEEDIIFKSIIDDKIKRLKVIYEKAQNIFYSIENDKITYFDTKKKKEIEKCIDDLQRKIQGCEVRIENIVANAFSEKKYTTRCLKNIRELLKTSNIKIGQIEREAKCQLGYVSRLEKETNSTAPSMEFLITASKMLGVSIDALLLLDMTELTPTEKYLMTFIHKLKNETLEDRLHWIKNEKNIQFVSKMFGENTVVVGECFKLEMSNNSTLFLMNVVHGVLTGFVESDKQYKEIWIYNSKGKREFIASDDENSRLSAQVNSLYDTVLQNVNSPKITNETKCIIDAFMNGEVNNEEGGD